MSIYILDCKEKGRQNKIQGTEKNQRKQGKSLQEGKNHATFHQLRMAVNAYVQKGLHNSFPCE